MQNVELFYAELDGLYKHLNDKIEQREHQASQQCGPKTLNADARNQRRHQPKHERVDHQQKEPKGENREGQREKNHERSHDGIHYAENNRADECGNPALHLNAADEVCHEQQQGCCQNKMCEEREHKYLLVRLSSP